MKRKAGPPAGPGAAPATSGDVADRRMFPQRRARAEPFKAILALPEAEQLAAFLAHREAMVRHPDTEALRILEAHLQDAHLDPAMQGSPEVLRLVGVLRELVADVRPGESVEEMLEPLRTVLSRHGGGRPKDVERWAEWRRRVDSKLSRNRLITRQEAYEDVAAEWAAEGHRTVQWREIQKAMGKLKRSK